MEALITSHLRFSSNEVASHVKQLPFRPLLLLLSLFHSFCTPIYTCQLWWNFSVQTMHKLNVAYNNAFRFTQHLPTYCSASLMFVVNRVPNWRAVNRNRIYGFMKRLVSSSNALVLSTVTMRDSVLELFDTG